MNLLKGRGALIKDPRMIVGALLVLGGGVLGGMVLSGEQTVAVARVESPIAAGEPVLGNLSFVEIPEASAGSQVRRSDVDGLAIAGRSLAVGEFLEESDLADDPEMNAADVRVPLAYEPSSTVGVGERVEVWRINNQTTPGEGPGAENLAVATLIAVRESDGITAQSSAELRLGPADVPDVLAAMGGGDTFILVAASYGGE